MSNNNHAKVRSEALERGKGNGNSNDGGHEARYDGRQFSEFIKKKLGSVELEGRKNITTPVLDIMLLIRCALSFVDIRQS